MKEEYCINKTKEVLEGRKYSCKLCHKAFKSPEFVMKHIKNKHEDRLNEKFNYSYFQRQARDNYLDDPNRISNVSQIAEINRQNSMGGVQPFQKRDFGNNRHLRRTESDNPEKDKQADGAWQAKTKDYVDYDDPTQFAKGGQRFLQQQIQQQQLQQQAARELQQLQAKPQGNMADRQLVTYDDLF